MDWGEVRTPDNPMKAFFSLPQVLGHEVVADVVELGPEAEGVDVGDRVVLNPWLSCGPRGVSPVCPPCERGDYSLCHSFDVGPIPPGIHIGTARDANGGYAELMPAHDSQLFKVPDSVPDELAVFADPFTVSLHSITRHPPAPGGKAMVYGAGALGTCADRDPARAVSRRRRLGGGALRRASRDGAQARRDRDRPYARTASDRGSGGVVGWGAARERRSADGVPRRDRRRVRHRREARDLRGRDTRVEGARHAREGRRARSDASGRTRRCTSRRSRWSARTRSGSRR